MDEQKAHDWQPSAIEAFLKAVELMGGQVPTANVCRCTQSNISQLIKNGSVLPSRYVLNVEAATGVSRHDLRPDIYPREARVASPLDDCGPILSNAALRGQSNSAPVLHSRIAAGRAA